MAAADGELKNWFNDPFFQVRDAIKACPIPLGPLMTEAQRRNEAHYRVERGTSCWLEGKCDKPNAYLYDAPIAAAIGQRFSQSPAFQDTSLWITVQRKFVIVQGCIADANQAGQIETLIKAEPDVDRVILQLVTNPHETPPYIMAPTESNVPNRSE
ncbi:MAG TPA: BON domain-containing protein [Burkholderiaceae bacterium]|nr:BON domain-containing protein [Burkholderiaceae bacterium]